MQNLLLSANHLTFARKEHCLFENLSFTLAAGECLLVSGENGTGKSTLLRLIAGLTTPLSGHLHNPSATHFIGHLAGIKMGLTVSENLLLFNQLHHSNTPIAVALEGCLLADQAHVLARHLSAGQKKRLSLAKLWLVPKSLWLLDEPFTALDVIAQQRLTERINDHLKNGGGCVISSHQPLPFKTTQEVRLGP